MDTSPSPSRHKIKYIALRLTAETVEDLARHVHPKRGSRFRVKGTERGSLIARTHGRDAVVREYHFESGALLERAKVDGTCVHVLHSLCGYPGKNRRLSGPYRVAVSGEETAVGSGATARHPTEDGLRSARHGPPLARRERQRDASFPGRMSGSTEWKWVIAQAVASKTAM